MLKATACHTASDQVDCLLGCCYGDQKWLLKKEKKQLLLSIIISLVESKHQSNTIRKVILQIKFIKSTSLIICIVSLDFYFPSNQAGFLPINSLSQGWQDHGTERWMGRGAGRKIEWEGKEEERV